MNDRHSQIVDTAAPSIPLHITKVPASLPGLSAVIDRSGLLNRIAGLLKRFPIVAILGARHIAKTTLATQIIRTYRGVSLCFDLEDPTNIAAGGSDAGATGADWTHRAGRNPAPPESVSSSVAHRALPLIKMLKTALEKGEHVIWER